MNNVIQANHIFRPVRTKIETSLDNQAAYTKRKIFKNRRSTKTKDMDDWRKVFDFLSWLVEKRKEAELEKYGYLKCLKKQQGE